MFVLDSPTHARIKAAERIVADRGGETPLIDSKPSDSPCYVETRVRVAGKAATTAGEAVALREQTEQLEFARPAVVTFTPQVARTRYILGRCYGDRPLVVGVRATHTLGDQAFRFVYQTAAFTKALVNPCCIGRVSPRYVPGGYSLTVACQTPRARDARHTGVGLDSEASVASSHTKRPSRRPSPLASELALSTVIFTSRPRTGVPLGPVLDRPRRLNPSSRGLGAICGRTSPGATLPFRAA